MQRMTKLMGLAVCLAAVVGSQVRAATPVRPEDFPKSQKYCEWRSVKNQGAKGDGVTDDTAAFRKALSARKTDPFEYMVIYVPAGTYVVSDTIGWGRRTWFVGDGADKTVIKLKDNCDRFSGKSKPVLWAGHKKAHYGRDSRANAAFGNYILDLTVDTGKGNAGAVGIEYTTHNYGYVGDVVVRSGDGSGPIGIDLSSTEFGPGMLRRVTIEGFDIGIKTTGNVSHGTLVDITLKNQNKLGILNRFPVTIHNLVSVNKVPAVRNDGGIANLAMVGAKLTGGSPDHCAIEQVKGSGLLSDVKTAGYKAALKLEGKVIDGASIDERVLGPEHSVYDGTPIRALRLAESPPPVFEEPRSQWKVVDDSAEDDTETIQAAIDSGAKTLFFIPGGDYDVTDTIRVRGKVRRLIGFGFGTTIRGPGREFVEADKPVMRFEGDGKHPISVEWINAADGAIGAEIATPRTVYFQSTRYMGYRNTPEARKIFIDEGMGHSMFVAPAKVVIRQCNMENNPFGDGKLPCTYIRNRGADVCVLGFKTEAPAVHAVTTDGGKTEVLGGFFRDHFGPTDYEWHGAPPLPGVDMSAGVPYWITKDASLTATYFQYAWAGGKARALQGIEIRGDQVEEFRVPPNNLNLGLYSAINEAATPDDRMRRRWPAVQPKGATWPHGENVTVSLELPAGVTSEDVAVRYTLDGSKPTLDSKRYTGPFTLDETTTVTARCFWGDQGGGVGRQTYRFVRPRKAAHPPATTPGVRYTYYEGGWGAVPDPDEHDPKSKGVVKNFGLEMASADDNFALWFEGYVEVPREGMYTFYTASDDGSVLYIGDELVVDNDLPHGMLTASGKINLEAGKHPIRVGFFESRGGQGLKVMWKVPGADEEPIPDSALSHGARWSVGVDSTQDAKAEDGAVNVALAVQVKGGGSKDANIRYTLDGSAPDKDATLYTAPITVKKSCKLRARCFKDGHALPGPEAVRQIFVLGEEGHPASPPVGAGAVGGAGTVDSPLELPKAPREIAIDGDLDDWKGVASLPMPFEGVQASGVRFAWSDQGLYGSALVVDDSIAGADYDLYKADCVEVFIEKDFARAEKDGKTMQLTVGPAASGKPGDAALEVWGYDRPWQNLIKAAWAKTSNGYAIEFIIPARLLRPAKMTPDTKVSFNVVIIDDGKSAAQFLSDKSKDQGFKKPVTWGAAMLTK
ncbi:MAG: chitobiase/beta-hexosaminidase C-terminal domain-containing protein [Phycisphaerae bacterium]|nr:chitobiase/beta-hexosaminidase C-terminal domain-containing protein [Phycisphaerae bacterium]